MAQAVGTSQTLRRTRGRTVRVIHRDDRQSFAVARARIGGGPRSAGRCCGALLHGVVAWLATVAVPFCEPSSRHNLH